MRVQKSLYEYIIQKSEFVPDGIVPSKGLSRRESLDIYRKAYGFRLVDALAENYEAVYKCLGDELFISLCGEFIKKQEASSWSLSHYHPHFVEFLKHSALINDYPFISQMAELDLLSMKLFGVKDERGEDFSVDQIQEDLFAMSLKFVSSLYIYTSDFLLVDLYKSFIEDVHDDTHSHVHLVEDWQTPQCCILYKDEGVVRMRGFSIEFATLAHNMTKTTLMKALEESPEIDPIEAQSFFEFLFSQKLLKTSTS